MNLNIRALYIIVGLFLLTSCGLVATKRDIADLKKDVQGLREEIKSGARDQEFQAQRQTEMVIAVKDKISEKRTLADLVNRGSPWTWFGLEFLMLGSLSFTAAHRLNRKYGYRWDPVTDDEYESLTVASWVLNKFLGQRRIESPKTDPNPPGPPDDKPPLRVVR